MKELSEQISYDPKLYLHLQQGATVEVEGEEFFVTFTGPGVRIQGKNYRGSVVIDLSELVSEAVQMLKDKGKKTLDDIPEKTLQEDS